MEVFCRGFDVPQAQGDPRQCCRLPPPQQNDQSTITGKLPTLPVPCSNTYATSKNSLCCAKRSPWATQGAWFRNKHSGAGHGPTCPCQMHSSPTAKWTQGCSQRDWQGAGTGPAPTKARHHTSPSPWGCNGVNRNPSIWWWLLQCKGVRQTQQSGHCPAQQLEAPATQSAE